MQIDWLITFLEIHETRNFNLAAENLGVTQSTVSARIRALEESLNARLFVRGRGGASPTIEGTRFLSYANNILLTWNLASHELGQPLTHQSVLRISTQMSIWEHLVNSWLGRIRKMFPKTSIHLEADYSKTIVEELQRGYLDIGVVYAPEYTANVEIEHLFNDRFMMISPQPMTLKQITPDNYVFVALTEYFKARHHELLPHLHEASVTMGLSIVSRSYLKKHGGAAYASERQASGLIAEGEFFAVEDAPVIEQPVFVSYLSKNRHKPIYAQTLKALREIVAASPHH